MLSRVTTSVQSDFNITNTAISTNPFIQPMNPTNSSPPKISDRCKLHKWPWCSWGGGEMGHTSYATEFMVWLFHCYLVEIILMHWLCPQSHKRIMRIILI